MPISMLLTASRRKFLKIGVSGLLATLAPTLSLGQNTEVGSVADQGGDSQFLLDDATAIYRLPLTRAAVGTVFKVPEEFLSAIALDGCGWWAALPAFDQPELIVCGLSR